jgi:hypothetical protein
MKFAADVEGKARELFDNAFAAIRYGMKHVYLDPVAAILHEQELNEGRSVMWSYGFGGVIIYPVNG